MNDLLTPIFYKKKYGPMFMESYRSAFKNTFLVEEIIESINQQKNLSVDLIFRVLVFYYSLKSIQSVLKQVFERVSRGFYQYNWKLDIEELEGSKKSNMNDKVTMSIYSDDHVSVTPYTDVDSKKVLFYEPGELSCDDIVSTMMTFSDKELFEPKNLFIKEIEFSRNLNDTVHIKLNLSEREQENLKKSPRMIFKTDFNNVYINKLHISSEGEFKTSGKMINFKKNHICDFNGDDLFGGSLLRNIQIVVTNRHDVKRTQGSSKVEVKLILNTVSINDQKNSTDSSKNLKKNESDDEEEDEEEEEIDDR
jgi:hypothetical protein